MGEYTDINGAAEFLCLKPRTVRAMAGKDFPVYPIGPAGGRLRFKVSELRAYVESRRQLDRRVPAEEYRTRLAGRDDGRPAQFI